MGTELLGSLGTWGVDTRQEYNSLIKHEVEDATENRGPPEKHDNI